MKNRSKNGGVLCEAAAAIAVLLPVVVLLTFVVLEVSQSYLIKTSLAQGARQAARMLAISYGKDPLVANSRTLQEQYAFDHVRINNMINDSNQFENATFDTNATPRTVHVRVSYLSDQYGLPKFPNPDPLGLQGRFRIFAESTYRLE